MKNSFYAACYAISSLILVTSCSKSSEDLVVPESLTSASIAGPGTTASNYTFVNHLYGFRVVPTNSSLGHGVFTLNYNGNAKTVSYTLTYERVIPTAAHIHAGMPNENGPVVFDLGKPTNSPFEGSIALTDAQVSDLVNGKMYIDIHTAIFPDGEIRAQIGKEQ